MAATILAVAAFDEGRDGQAFSNFGPERTGAPVVSCGCSDDHEIRTRESVMELDAATVQDARLISQIHLFAGLAANGYVEVNASPQFDELGVDQVLAEFHRDRLVTCLETEITLERVRRPFERDAS